MLLAIDIGNTNVTIGIYPFVKGKIRAGAPVVTWRLETDKHLTADEYGIKMRDMFHYARLDTADIKAVAIASVVPALNTTFEEMSRTYLKCAPFFVGRDEKCPVMKVLNDNPSEVGADRIANAVAAFELLGGPCIVIDFGTATTFDCITKEGAYAGGAICPGPHVAVESLVRRTAQLPMIQLVRPKKYIGRSTVTCMQSGLYFGYVGLIKELLAGITREMGGKPTVIATGGLARIILNEIKEVKKVVPELTLEGIRLIWEKSR